MSPIPPPAASGTTGTTPVPLYWAAWGPTDAPPVLLLHGGPGAHHDYLLPQLLHLADRHRVIAYDQRGGGRSRTDDPAPITAATHVADLALVVRELLGDAPPVLVGYSWGALLAMLYAIEAAAGRVAPRPARLALVSPAPITAAWRAATDAEFAARGRAPALAALRAEHAASPLRTSDPAAYRQRAFELAVAPWFAEPSRAAGLTPFRLVEKVQRSVWESLGDFDLRPALATVRVPALVVAGRQDPIPVENAEACAEALGAAFVCLDACGHVPYVEAADALFAALDPFLADSAGPAPTSR